MPIPLISEIDVIGLFILLAVALVMLRPEIRNAQIWRATVTPLASIIGSGFLIVAPLLAHIAGSYAAAAMLGIALLAFWIGSAVRYNIMQEAHYLANPSQIGARYLERISSVFLSVAYVISVAFYIRLLAAFVLNAFGMNDPFASNLLASFVLLFIAAFGYYRGLRGLERLEEYSVTIKLAIIASLLVWLLQHDILHGYNLSSLHADDMSFWEKLRLLAGILLVVQGFETSKYLGSVYSAKIRSQTMTRAQMIAAFIYIGFVALMLPLMTNLPQGAVSETALISLIGVVSPLLPPLLVIAAVMSQFSAAIADTLSAGGMASQQSKNRLDERFTYPIIALGAILLIWSTNIFELVSIASRAFAIFYFFQAVLAVHLAFCFETGFARYLAFARHAALALVMLMVVIFAKAIEG